MLFDDSKPVRPHPLDSASRRFGHHMRERLTIAHVRGVQPTARGSYGPMNVTIWHFPLLLDQSQNACCSVPFDCGEFAREESESTAQTTSDSAETS